jgi:hypothetical protein
MAPSGDTIAQVHTGLDSSNKTLLKSEALYKVRIYVLHDSRLSTRYSTFMLSSMHRMPAVRPGHVGAATRARLHA